MAPARANGSTVTRAELGAHLERIDGSLGELHVKVDEISETIGAGRRWMLARFTTAIDRGVVVCAAAVIAYIASH